MRSEAEVIVELHRIGAIQFGSFVLKSGMTSPFYIDLRLVISYPSLFRDITLLLIKKVGSVGADCICGIPYTAIPLATSFALAAGMPLLLVRKEAKSHGMKKQIEGHFSSQQTCLLIEDIITTGSSVFEIASPLRQADLFVHDVAVVVDRGQGGKEWLKEKRIDVHALFSLKALFSLLMRKKKITEMQYEQASLFLQQHQRVEVVT